MGNQLRKGKVPTNAFRKGQTVGANNVNWKGEDITYGALHDYVTYHLGSPGLCENCGSTDHARYEWANLSGEYKRDLSDWARLCKMCHHLIDNSMRGLDRTGGKAGRKWKRKVIQ